MRLALLSALLLSSCAATAPQGGSHYGPVTGESLVTFGGTLTRIDLDAGGDTTAVSTQAGFGYFITEEHEVGGQALVTQTDGKGFRANSYAIAPYYNYNFRQSSRTWYYAGPHIGLVRTETKAGGVKNDDTSGSFGVHVGMRQWLTPRTSWFVEPRYTTSSDFDDLTLLFGLNFTL